MDDPNQAAGGGDDVSLNLGLFDIQEAVTQRLAFLSKKSVQLSDLLDATKFTKQEICQMYRGFKQECPDGIVQEETFKEIYGKFFPHGNSSLYAHHVFHAFDANKNGSISFRDMLVSLSTLLRGTTYEKLRWTFTLYDLNKDGFITKQEVTNVVLAVHELMGIHGSPQFTQEDLDAQVELLFTRLDQNGDGVVTIEEFIDCCQTDPVISTSLRHFNTTL